MKKGPRTVRIVFKDTHLDEIPLIINPTYNWDLLWYFIDSLISHFSAPTVLTNLVPISKLVRDKMRDTKMPEFVIHPFGNIRGCPKNILNQFKKQIFRTASDGNGWIIHDGISDMAKLMADAVKAG